MTSATLAVTESRPDSTHPAPTLAYFRARVGAGDCRELVVGSPFNYSRQMRLCLVKDMPDPNDAAQFRTALAPAIGRFVKQTDGRAFVLFTSAVLMRAIAADLADFFADHNIVPLVQGGALPKHAMLTRFRRAGRWVLFGLDSFWMGVDVRGAALSNVIIARLPFAVPDEPVARARMDRITARGGDAFREYALPEAILRLRQGIGRLIRTSHDAGMVVILDSRIITKWYGRHFLQALPACPVEIIALNDANPHNS